MKIIGISGSLRRHSHNTALLRAAAGMMPAGAVLEIAPIAEIPLYDGDLEEADGLPPAVTALKDAIAGADGLVLAAPEYNSSVPGVLKNALDWASRPTDDIARVFGDRPVALMGASPSAYGTVLGQAAWLPVLRRLGMRLWTGGQLMAGGSGKLFDADGTLTDTAMAERLRRFMAGFVDFAGERRVGAPDA